MTREQMVSHLIAAVSQGGHDYPATNIDYVTPDLTHRLDHRDFQLYLKHTHEGGA